MTTQIIRNEIATVVKVNYTCNEMYENSNDVLFMLKKVSEDIKEMYEYIDDMHTGIELICRIKENISMRQVANVIIKIEELLQ